MNHSEHTFQAAAYVYLCRALPQHALIWGVDHAGKRTPIQGARLKQRGIIPGICDLFVFSDGVLIGFELKAGKNDATDMQEAFAARIKANRGYAFTVWSLEDIEFSLRDAGITPRAMAMTAQERDARLAAKATAKPSRSRAEKPSTDRIRRMEAVRGKVLF